MRDLLSHPLVPGTALTYWQVGATAEARYDLPDMPMQGEMDPFFFLTKDKNFIPHEYPCRTQFAAERRGVRPETTGLFAPLRNWLPFGSPRLDLSGFWFRPTHIATWAQTVIRADQPGTARLRLRTCGGAVLFVGGTEAGWMAPYRRNAEIAAEFDVALQAGENEIRVFFDDLAERDARYYIQLDYLSGPSGRRGSAAGLPRGLGAVGGNCAGDDAFRCTVLHGRRGGADVASANPGPGRGCDPGRGRFHVAPGAWPDAFASSGCRATGD